MKRSGSADSGAPWSETVGGLRAHVVGGLSVAAGQQLRLELELENVGSDALQVLVDEPFAFTASLQDGSGNDIKPGATRLEVLASPRWTKLESHARVRYSVAGPTRDGAAPAQLDTVTSVWKLAPGKYRMAARYHTDDASQRPAGGWNGSLTLAPVDLEVTEK